MTQPIEEFGAYLEESFDNFCDQVKDADGSTGIACIDQCEDYGIGVGKLLKGILFSDATFFEKVKRKKLQQFLSAASL